MWFEGFMIYLVLKALGAVCGLLCLIFLVRGIYKKNKKSIFKAFIPILLFVVICCGFYVADRAEESKFNKIESLQINNDTVSILNSGTVNAYSSYIIAEQDSDGKLFVRCNTKNTDSARGNYYSATNNDILNQSSELLYRYHYSGKHGYSFKAEHKGTAYLGIAEHDFGTCLYLDIYKINVDDDKQIRIDNIEHFGDKGKSFDDIPDEYEIFRSLTGNTNN